MDLKSNDKYLYKRQREDTQKRGVTENEAETGVMETQRWPITTGSLKR